MQEILLSAKENKEMFLFFVILALQGTGTNAQTKEFGDFCRHMKRPMFVIAGNRETQAFCLFVCVCLFLMEI
jgi:hypothetical protein